MRTGQGMALLIASLWPSVVSCGQTTGGPPSFDAISKQAAVARDSDHLTDAVRLYRQALALKPDWAEGWWSLGTLQYDLNNYADAVAAFRKLCAADRKSGSGRVMLGLSEFELGQDSDALADIQAGQHIGVVDNEQLRNVALYHEGVLLQRAGKFEAAQRAIDSLCIAGLETPEQLTVLGMIALRMKDREKPAKAPDRDVVARVGRAQCLAARKQFDEAQREYKALTSEFPDYPKVHYAFGRFLIDAQDVPGGIAELETEIKRNPADSQARLQIAAAKYKSDSRGGIPYARAAVQHDPSLALGHYLLGLLLLDCGDYRQAIPELERAQRTMSQVPDVYSALGAAYSEAGRDQDAARARETLQRLHREAATSPAPRP